MKKAILVSKLIAGIIGSINGIYALAARTGEVAGGFPDWAGVISAVVFGIVGVFLVVGSVLDFVSENRKSIRQYRFQYQSDPFFRFFADWYKQPGKLSIICGSLDWTKNESNTEVYRQLLNKSRRGELVLLLGDGIHSELVSELKTCGAQVMPAPHNIVASYTFSCISVMDDAAGKIIVRDKHKHPAPPTGEVIIDEISNTLYITELLNALLTKEVCGL